MASTYSNLKLQLMATGENTGTWGSVTNVNLGTALEEAIVGSADVAFSGADITLTLTNTNASQTARNLRLVLTGTSGGNRQLVVPAIEKVYIVKNELANQCTVKVSGGTGVVVPAGQTMWLYNNGVDVVDVITYISSLAVGGNLSGTTGSFSGDVTFPTQTAGDNSTKAATTAFVTTAITNATGSLGTMSTQNANNVNITGGTVSGLTSMSATTLSGAGSAITALNASNLASGTVPATRLPAAAQTTLGAVKAYVVGTTLYINTA